MSALVDSDAFCKLAVGDVLGDAVHLLGAELSECRRLPALPHMLRRGRLREVFGPERCDALVQVAEILPALARPSAAWLDRLAPIEAIDSGEAQLFAAAAEHGLIVISGDKRALRALKGVNPFPAALAGRIVVLEAILIALCESLGSEEVRRRVQPLRSIDNVIKICFSNPLSDPRDGLRSYFEGLATELAPLVLWSP